eukprot:4059087-Pleurochrysis_carterae.AAC.1
MKNKRGTKANTKANNRTRLRRLTQQRIRRWNKARNRKYDEHPNDGYGGEAQLTEAKEANTRECRKRGREKREKDTRRRGGSGGRGRARAVNASSTEEVLMMDIGVPQYTWGDGSCWLWAVAGALHKLEGREGPTEKDIQLEKECRAEIQ